MPLTFSRAEFLELVDVPNDLLGYWLQGHLVRPVEEKLGRGQPRTFGPEDLMLGAIFRELHGYGIKAKLYAELSANAYSMIWTGRGVQLPHRLLPYVLKQALALRSDLSGVIHGPVGYDTGDRRPGEERAIGLNAGEEAMVDALAADLGLEEAANLDGYFHLTNPAYLRREDPPHMVWDYVAGEDGYELLERAVDAPSMVSENEQCASCVTVSLTTVARRLWGVEGSRIGRLPFEGAGL
jgi:hypothetical protein